MFKLKAASSFLAGMVLVLFFSLLLNTHYTYASTILQSRLAGSDRYKTAVAISKSAWTTSDNLVLATGENFPDALCAAPLAKQLNAPILLTEKDNLNSDTQGEIVRLEVKKVYIIGGPGVISDNVMAALQAQNINSVRLYGDDRYQTALAVAKCMNDLTKTKEIAVAGGEDFSDALSISPIAAEKNMPILLIPKDSLPNSIKEFINENKFEKTYVVGGSDIISENVTNQFLNTERISGSDKYERNISVLNRFSSDIRFDKVYVATGENYPDALAGSVLASMTSSPIILLGKNTSKTTLDYITPRISSMKQLKVLGGEGAVSSTVLPSIFGAIEDGQYLLSTEEVDSNSSEIIELAQKITKGLNTDFEKTKAIYDWICNNITYESYYSYVINNQPWYNLTFASNVLQRKSSNCLGFSNLNAALHRAIGIKARVVDGWAYNPNEKDTWMKSDDSRHSWNEVLIDDKWVIEDSTMDSSPPFRISHKYFNPDPVEFEKDHRRDKVRY